MQLVNVFEEITRSSTVWTASCVILAWAVIGGARFSAQIEKVRAPLKRHVDRVSASPGPEEFVEPLMELEALFEECPVIGHSWHEFSETLIYPEPGERQVVRNSISADSFFTTAALVSSSVNLRFYNAFPSILTGLGILGTFIGLVAGIGLAANGLVGGPKESKEALEGLLSGASLAFMTSIAGLVSSITFSWWEKSRLHEFDSLRNRWAVELDKRLVRVTVEDLAVLELRESEKQSLALTDLSQRLAFQLVEALEKSVDSRLTPVLERIATTLDGLRDDQQAASDETLERLVHEFTDAISGAAGQEMKAFAATIEKLDETLTGQVDQLARTQEGMQEASKQALEDLARTFAEGSREITDGIRASMTESIEELSSVVQSMSKGLSDATEEAVNKVREIVSEFERSVGHLQETIGELRESNVENQKMLQEAERLTNNVAGALEAIKVSAESIEAASFDLGTTAKGAGEANAAITNAVGQISALIDQLAGAQNELKVSWGAQAARFEKVDAELEAVFTRLSNGLSGYSEQTRDYLGKLQQETSRMGTTLAGAVSNLEETVSEMTEALEAAAGRSE